MIKNLKKNIIFLQNNKNYILNIILSFISTVGINLSLENNTNNLYTSIFSNSFINIFIFILYINLFNKMGKIKKDESIFSFLFSTFLSIVITIGSQLERNSQINFTILTLLIIFCLILSIYPLILIILRYINKIKNKNIINLNNKKIFLITFFIILFFDFLVFLAIYPGVYGYDAGYEILQILDKNTQITTHFSVFYSLILAEIVNFGKTIFGSYQIGFAIYTFIQMLFMSYVSTKISCYSFKKTGNKFIYLFCILFFSLFPLYTVMTLSASQDVFFGGIFSLLILNLLKLIEDKDYWKKIYNPIILFCLILFLCIFRNNGFYAVIVLLPCVLLFNKNKRALTFILILLSLISYKIYSGPILEHFNIQNKDSIREMMSIPSQQLARVYNYNYSSFNKKQLNYLKIYYFRLKDFKYYTYRQSISDPTKNVLNIKNTSKNITGYIKLWSKIGIKNPENYTEAFLLNSLGFWYPNKNYKDDRMYHPYIEYQMLDAKTYNKKYISIKRNSKFKLYEKLLNITLDKNAWKKVPIISTIFTSGTYFIILIFLIFLTIYNKNFKLFLPIGLIVGLYLTLFLSPVALFRYCYPIVILLPVFISLILNNKITTKN